jgi:hypothetical protein
MSACRDPHCAIDREAKMVVLERDASGKARIWCDPCIAPLVKALNDAGIRTIASCCGHGKDNGSVILADGRELLIRRFDPDNHRAEAA